MYAAEKCVPMTFRFFRTGRKYFTSNTVVMLFTFPPKPEKPTEPK